MVSAFLWNLKMIRKTKHLATSVLCVGALMACDKHFPDSVVEKNHTNISIPVEGNSWIDDSIELSDSLISGEGISLWYAEQGSLSTYFYVSKPGELHVSFKGKVESTPATVQVVLAEQSKTLTVENTQVQSIPVGTFMVTELGYQKLTITGLDAAGTQMPAISEIEIGGTATKGSTYFVKDDFYWGRRGPSVHLKYQMPDESEDYQWFYSEILVPKDSDTIGSYYMANGFNGGYFGIQVNSDTERRVLFSIWSPFSTDNPEDIPPEYRVTTLKHGDNVQIGKFGNEGSGGQSFLRYNWEVDTHYGFLTKISPVKGTDSTDFTAYFYDPKIQQWQLIASFRRPKTSTYHNNIYSFLENFIPGSGQFERSAIYTNQWVKPVAGEWQEITNAQFTYDATARKEARLDYQGGTTDKGFYLKNTGFFSAPTPYGSIIHRSSTQKPDIDLQTLP